MSATLSPINSINPASAEVLARFDPFTPDEVDHALDQAEDAFIAWRERSFEERAVPMRRLAALLRERADRYGRLITLEMGKPIVEARAELEKYAWGCEHYAEHAARYLADEVITTNARRSLVAFQPLGIVLAVADLGQAAKIATRARNQNTGQSCIAAKRFIAVESIATDFERRFAAEVAALQVGDPLDTQTQIGPLAREDLRETLERQVR